MNQRGFTLLELIMVIGILMLVSSIMLTLLNPTQRLKEAFDAQRITAVHSLKNAIESYQTIYNEPPHCDDLGTCPINFEIDGSDTVSQAILSNELLKTIPTRAGENGSSLCNYQVYLYPSQSATYSLRWCFESWTEATVNEANATSTAYECEWAPSEELAYCYTGPLLGIPPLKL